MAKASIKVRMPDDLFIGMLDQLATDLGRHGTTEAHFSLEEPFPPGSPLSDVEITMEGRGFTYKNGMLVGGIIKKVTYQDEDGNDLAVYTGLNSNIAKIADSSQDFAPFQNLLLKGDDVVTGSREADVLFGGAGDDVIKGFNGADIIAGGRGNDTLTGDLGNDEFNLQAATGSVGNDVITDFEAGVVVVGGIAQDLLIVDKLPDLTRMEQVGADTVIDLGDGFSVTLLNVLTGDITQDDFEVV